jgi:hypothetical protein
VLQSAVDAITAEMAAPAPPAEPHEAGAPAAALIEPDEVFAAAEEVEEAAPAPQPAPAPVAAPDEVVWQPEPARLVAEPAFDVASQTPPPQPPAIAAQPVAGQESAEDLFGGSPHAVEAAPEPLPAPAPVPEVPAAPPTEAPAPQATVDTELFTAPEAEEAPVLLKKVLQAPTPEPRLDPAAVQPPASLTLARLYVQQEALGESVRILERLLEREPGNVEARDLLALVRDIMEPLPAEPPRLSRRERRIAALQRWLASLTLGRERATR